MRINSSLQVSIEDYADKIPFAYARVESNNKFSQIYIAAEKKLYLPDFWRNGVCLANGATNNILVLAEAINFWILEDVPTKTLSEKFTFVTPNANAQAFDENNEVQYQWDYLLHDKGRAELKDFIDVAIKDEVLNRLFPFTSLYTLCFSRCTGYPYNINDIPNVTPKLYENFALPKKIETKTQLERKNEPIFVVTKNKKDYIGEGDAIEALQIVKKHLPKDIMPAVNGTAESLK